MNQNEKVEEHKRNEESANISWTKNNNNNNTIIPSRKKNKEKKIKIIKNKQDSITTQSCNKYKLDRLTLSLWLVPFS